WESRASSESRGDTTARAGSGRDGLDCGGGGAAQGVRGLAERAQKGPAHPFGVAEADGRGDRLERFAAAFDPGTRRLGPQALDRLGRGDARGGGEGTAELAHAEAGDFGETFDRQRIGEVLAREHERPADAVRARVEVE